MYYSILSMFGIINRDGDYDSNVDLYKLKLCNEID